MRAFVYERDMPDIVAVMLLLDANWPDEAAHNTMKFEQWQADQERRVQQQIEDDYWADQEQAAREDWFEFKHDLDDRLPDD